VWLHSRLEKIEVVRPVATAGVKTVAAFIGVRIALLLVYLGAQYALLHAFGVNVPLRDLVVYLPILTLVQTIPISISGLGAAQLVMRRFYAPFVAGAAFPAAVIDAYSTTEILGFMLLRILVAYLCLGRLSKEVIRNASKLEEEVEGSR